jgi:hypothetical protein
MAFRKQDIKGTNKIFIEMPFIVKQYLYDYDWTKLDYDTVAVRIHPGGNTCTKSWYYKESPSANWIELCGRGWNYFPGFVQIKNNAPHLLFNEIRLAIYSSKKCLKDFKFWFYAIVSVITPRFMLRILSNYYRNVLRRGKYIIRKRNENIISYQ